MKIVSPYRPIEPYMPFHIELAKSGFDWLKALAMLRHSAASRASVETFAITDSVLPVPHYRYETNEPSLMVWIVEVSSAYIESTAFDQDTVMISPDALVLDRLDVFGGFDVGVIARQDKFANSHPLLNGLQFWPIASKEKLIVFYREALRIARNLSDAYKRWGADTQPLVQLLQPIVQGLHNRNGLVVKMFMHGRLMRTIGVLEKRALKAGFSVPSNRCTVLDFKARNKRYMEPYFKKVFGV